MNIITPVNLSKVITFANQINDSEFILIKLKLKQENL